MLVYVLEKPVLCIMYSESSSVISFLMTFSNCVHEMTAFLAATV